MTIIAPLLFSPPLVSFTANQQRAIIWTTGANYANERTLGWPVTFPPGSHLFTVCKLPRVSETCLRMSKHLSTESIIPQKTPPPHTRECRTWQKRSKTWKHPKSSRLPPGGWVRHAFNVTEVSISCNAAVPNVWHYVRFAQTKTGKKNLSFCALTRSLGFPASLSHPLRLFATTVTRPPPLLVPRWKRLCLISCMVYLGSVGPGCLRGVLNREKDGVKRWNPRL